MQKKILFFLLTMCASPLAAQEMTDSTKLDGGLTRLMQYRHTTRGATDTKTTYAGTTYDVANNIPMTIVVTDAKTVAKRIVDEGYAATAISDTYVTARVPLSYLSTLTTMEEVERLNLARRHRPFLNKARAQTKVNAVHKGAQLETPYTGKGVILGIIDQGFQFDHPAFQNAQGTETRIRAFWDRSNEKIDTKPSTGPFSGGETEGEGHATHVTNIAAGTDLGNDLYGVAPDAEIIMISTQFSDDEIQEDVKYIKEFAEKEGKPWVVNMSFGSDLGPHDGMTDYDQNLNALTGAGGHIVAAMGNEADMLLHTMGEITPGKKKYILIDHDEDSGYAAIQIWNQNTDGKRHLKVTPFYYYNNTINTNSNIYWRNHANAEEGVHPRSGKENFYYEVDMEQETKTLKQPNALFGLQIELAPGETQPQTIHAWTNENTGEFSSMSIPNESRNMLRGDNQYLVGEGAASIPNAIAVGSYNSSTSYYSMPHKKNYYANVGSLYQVSFFSNLGPFLDSRYPKPTVVAPGAMVRSATNRYDSEFMPNQKDITATYQRGNVVDYYTASAGTSMASPFVAGTLCLWLQAYPNLTPEQALQVIRETATDLTRETTNNGWSPEHGYGKIDAYNGLKKVLELAQVNGMTHINNSATPVSILKSPDTWKLLFNNPEQFATIRVYDLRGMLIESHHLEQPQQGDEISLRLSDWRAGTYLVNIRTGNSNTTHHALVR